MRFYDLGGGEGIGIDLSNQTLPFDQLGLSDAEKNALVALMHAFSDTTGTFARPNR